ncbi:MAG TPA: molybdate ABC transporter permease subunit [Firmicutes bacterium]|jgi:molybdate transport system permease protein|nr:molybdate ABC transporter permease subunit [Bacillota bacterium]HAA34826.1 molybdate ABC transporter permease subunit [Bacillota bacterium]
MDMSPLWISLKTSVSATFLAFILGVTAAKLMSGYQGRLKNVLDGVFILPLVLPPTVVGFLLLVLFGRHGPLGQLLSSLGTTVIFSWSATVIASTVVAFPLMYRTARGAFEQVDPNMLDAARTMGVPERSIFTRITIPLAWPGIAAGTILAFARALGEFGATLMLAGNIPGKTQTIPLTIFFLVESGQRTKAAVWVLIIIAISLAAISGLHYWTKCQIPAGGRPEK